MRIAVGADDSHPLVQVVVDWCTADGHTVDLVADGRPWPEAGRLVGEAVVSGAAARGVVMCWTGTGVSIAANKVPGVRAALCADAETARGARRWNDANVLALSMRSTALAVAEEILAAFVHTDDVDPDEARHVAAVS
jgi:ribose 5-phosphate isomerase B